MTERVTRRRVLRGVAAGATVASVADTTAATENDRTIVGLEASAKFDVARSRATSVHREMDFGRIGKAVAGQFSASALQALENSSTVRYVEEDGTAHALSQSVPWGVDRVDADVVHDGGNTGAGADVAILDTGIDEDHPDLQDNLGAGKAYTNCDGSNGSTCNNAWDDDNGHGTHCAGTADAIDNSEGVVGVATEATLHAVKVLGSSGSGSFSDIAAGIEYVADQGWDVCSMSLGGSSSSSTLQDACQYASDNGVLLVAAAGNSGPCSDCVGYPAAYSTVIAVSSTTEDDSLSSFSSTGPEVELAAPGSNVNSTVPGGDYGTKSGTSMACPHVSGAGGHLMANGFTNDEARTRLQNTAENIGLSDNEQGNGLLDAEAAVLGAGFSIASSDATDVDGSSATLNGSLNNLDDASSADVYFEWRETGASSWNTTPSQTLSSTGSFSETVTGLSTGTEYEFRAAGSATDGDADTGSTLSFVASDCADVSNWPSGTGVGGYEYFTQVDVDGQVVESSSNADYYDFTCPDVVQVTQGGSFQVALDYEDDGYDGHYANVYVDWDGDGSWTSSDETVLMENVSDDTTTYTATVNVPSGAATGSTLARVRLSYDGFDGPTATGEYGEVNDFTVYVEDGGESAPTVDSLAASEVETDDGDAEFDVDWAVSDADSDLSAVDLTLADDTAGETEDTVSVSVSGSSASGTTRLVAAGDDGAGNDYTVETTVSDAGGNTSSATASATETDPTCVDASNWPSGTGVGGYEYFTQVDVDGQVVESSSNADYYDFTCPDVVQVTQGGSFQVALDYEDDGYDGHYANVYVDWDGDGSWTSSDETVLMENVSDDTTTYTATVNVPSGAATGSTLARVRLSYDGFDGPTATGEYGEVNDFTVVIE
jgi:subtilisin